MFTVFRIAFVLALGAAMPAMAAAPAATTTAATTITSSSAVLNGTGTPNGQATAGWFRYSTTSPGTCNDTFGTRLPTTSGTDLGSGAVAVAYSITATGLSSGVTYFFCAIVSNATSTAFGSVLSFTIPGIPAVTTSPASAVTSSSATLNGAANPLGAAATGWFRYSTTNPGTCNDTFGTRLPSSGGTSLGAGASSVAYTQSLTGLTPGATYYFCAIASNANGTGLGTVVSVTALAAAPTASTGSVTLLTGTTAQLNASGNPGADATTGWFRYDVTSPGSCNDSFGTRAPASSGSSLGSGTSTVSFSQPLAGLTPGVTYYYCALTSNSVGTAMGSVTSFTAPLPPTATTTAATFVTDTSAQLNGSGVANYASSNGWFRYAATDPGTCNDVFGSRAPTSGSTGLGSSTSSVAFAQSISSLSSGVTYYYCAIVSSAEGTAFGAVLTFRTQGPPTGTTTAATAITSSSATLGGSVNPNGATTTGWVRYATTNPGTCTDTFGTRLPSSGGSSLGSGSSAVNYTQGVSGLLPGTTYYYCAIATNAFGGTFGAVLSFTTDVAAPTVTTSSPTLLTGTTATLRGSANPGGAATTGWFRYATISPGTCNDTFGTRAPAVSGGSALGSGTSSASFTQAITGLTPGTLYYACAIATNSVATIFGNVVTFTTPLPPTVTTTAASLIGDSYAQLNGTGVPNGAATTGWFRYATTDPVTCSDTFGSRAPTPTGGTSLGSGVSGVTFAESLSGLSQGTTYYYCAIVSSAEGTAFGAVLTFRTQGPPTATTTGATGITSSFAALNGSANPNGGTTTGWIRYSLTNPGTCSDSFGTRVPTSSGGTSLGAGTSAVPFNQAASSLLPGTTYFYCAIASNSLGVAFGTVVSFTTDVAAPTISTSSATLLTGTTATLRGSSNPGGAATTGWFRYATTSPGTCNDSFGTRAPAVSGGSAVGSGTSSAAFTQPVTGLSPGTLYYYCAIASNSVGTVFGSLVTFTTPLPPTATTTAATFIGDTYAQLNGSGIPNGSATTGWFRYATTDPVTCNDTFGSRAPTPTGGTSLGSGVSSVTFAESIGGLSSGSTYYYCAIVSSAEGVAFGAVMTLRTQGPPTAATTAPTGITASAATLTGSANPNGATSTGWFRYATTSPGTCTDSFGTRTPSSGGAALGTGTSFVSYSQSIASLLPGTTYFYCAIASNALGTAFGTVVSFTTDVAAPTITTSSPTLLTGTTATLRGSSNPGGAATTGWFRYATVSPGTCNDSFGTRAPVVSGGSAVGSGTSSATFTQPVTGLTPGTLYYVCALASNSVGMVFGSLVTFTTPLPPTATTTAATFIGDTYAQLNGSGIPNGAAATGWFRYSAMDPVTCNDTFGSRAPTPSGGTSLGSGLSSVTFAESISGLSSGTTYYFCAITSSAEGVAFGSVLTLRTQGPPSAATAAATGLTSTTATLNGSANPNGAASTGWFRYSLTAPASCNDTFGTRLPSSGGTNLGTSTSAVPYAQSLSSLTPGTTYYFCAIANNTLGTAFGSVLSFTTDVAAPTVSTTSATLLTGTTATLRGSSNPGGAATTGWFRYDIVSPGVCNDTFGTRAPTTGTVTVGSGTTSTTFTQAITGLTPGTLYYYCAFASNSVATVFGSVVTFTTPLPPTTTTTAATFVTSTSAQLNGSGIPNGSATIGWFRYSATDPGTCNDTFGSRAPTPSGGTSLGSGVSNVTFAESLSTLSPGATYYYCAITSSTEGTSFGAVMTLRTQGPPSAATSPATSIAATSAVLNGSANPNGATSTGWFRYSATNPGFCNDTFGTRLPSSGGATLGAGTSAVTYAQTVTGLTPSATYYFCAIGSNTYGTAVGSVLSFTAAAAAPTVTTNNPSLLTSSSAQLNAAVNPGGAATTGWFRYDLVSPGTCNDSFGTRAPTTGDTSLGSGSSSVALSQAVTGLTTGATYYYCAFATNAVGTTAGSVVSFTVPLSPTVASLAATPVTSTTATLNGSGSPNGNSTTGWFRYSTTNPVTCNDTFGTRAPSSGGTSLGSGSAAVAFAQAITGLTPGTLYYSCAIASSSIATVFGEVLTFTTPSTQPTVTTVAASGIQPDAAVLNASANPGGGATTGWFRYATTNPGNCTDSFGTRTPSTGGTDLGSGNATVSLTAALSGLAPSTTYFYCAIASNGVGTAFGSILSFNTAVPIVTTQAATSVTNNGATLNGTANPNGTATTGWFRYSTTNPVTCNDGFGTRSPSSGGTSLGSGSPATYTQTLTGLAPLTTYYFCALALNTVGANVGTVLSFTTAGAPTVTSDPATAITAASATLNGTANPNGATATGWFRYSTTSPGSCNDTFGTRAPSSGGSSLGAGTAATAYTQSLSGLTPGATYYFCAIASNAYGTTLGTLGSFAVPTATPIVSTGSATLLTGTTAQIDGSANPNGDATTGWFRYATTNPGTCSDAFGTRAPAASGTALGAGNSVATFSQSLAGLVPGTTYYFCALASNSSGTSVGLVIPFTTAAPPTTLTVAATSITDTSATLNGSANPNGAATTGWFRYAPVDPGTCNDTFGTRAPSSAGASLGSGNGVGAWSQPVTGLAPATTYYFCALASNAGGQTTGTVLSFRTTAPPAVATASATSVTSTTATLNGSGTPNGATTTGWFRYATSTPGNCNDTFGTRMPANGGASVGSGTSAVAFSQGLTGLAPATTYYFCAIASNASGTTLGAVLTFSTDAASPSVVTNSPSSVTGTTATLNGSANPSGAASIGWFRYAQINPGTCNDTFGTRAPGSTGASLGAGVTLTDYSQAISGLTSGTTYYVCALASNAAGTSFGSVVSFTTLGAPVVVTSPASGIAETSATLNGEGNPNGAITIGWFRYATTDPGTCSDTFGVRAPTSSGAGLGSNPGAASYSQTVNGLVPGTTYYYCALASNSGGLSTGSVLSFRTLAAPSATTGAATLVSSNSATLNGSANPNGGATTGWFRYATTPPGTCSDTFGARIPSSGGASLGSGTSTASFSQVLSGLAPGTTYYYCAMAANVSGTGFGSVLSFTTEAATPVVLTNNASSATGTTATLGGSANPGGAATTGWFRYDVVTPGVCNDTFGTRAPTTGGSSIGTGTSAIAFAQAVTGLTPGTTYYFCALASNAAGLSVGSVVSFSTAALPSTVTSAATSVASTSATLHGAANPTGSPATGWFRFATNDPGNCDDTFGTRVPTSSGTALGAGSTSASFAQSATGLTPNTTYYFCALASNTGGTAAGTVLSFKTLAAPAVTSRSATLVTSTSATLNGRANPNGTDATGWFRYDTTSPTTCDDTFGTRVPSSSGVVLGTGSQPVDFTQALSSLTPGTTYYFCALTSNAVGTISGQLLSFATPPLLPVVTTLPASSFGPGTAAINATAIPGGGATTGWFRYDATNPGACNDAFGTRAPSVDGTALGSGTSSAPYAQSLSGLAPGTTYYYCALASNAAGTASGAVLSFTMPQSPATITAAATSVTDTAATLNGASNPNGNATTAWFRYASTDPGSCSDSFGTRTPGTGGLSIGAASTSSTFSLGLTGLAPNTVYYFCALASNTAGLSTGSVLSFRTPSIPSVTTGVATLVTSSSATLNGSATPSGAATTAWFRYDTTNPGSCSDAFGTRTPAGSDAVLGAGNSAVSFAQALSGLTPGKTYYYCALASNAYGTQPGSVVQFTTPALAPTVTTAAATLLAGTTVQLKGTAAANGDAATAWFRYGTLNPGTCSDAFGVRAPTTGGTAVGVSSGVVSLAETVASLAPGTTYYYCAIATNAVGTSFGQVFTFDTLPLPAATTLPATLVTSDGATLNASGTPNGSATTGWFRYGTINPGTCDDSFGTRLPATGGTALGAGSVAVSWTQAAIGLVPNTTYYFCALASNTAGVATGTVISFRTPAAPTVTTGSATLITSDAATLNGSASPNGAATTGWFRYDTIHPGTCSATFGTRSPVELDAILGSGTAAVPYSRPLTGLTAGTTYYYCAFASNAYGDASGSVASFTTPALVPEAATIAATLLAGTTVQLKGLALPNGDATIGWFRYGTLNPGSCSDAFGERAPSAGGTSLGSGNSAVSFTETLSALSAGTTYYYCAGASNAVGTAFGDVLSFSTLPLPTVTTLPATSVTATVATMNAVGAPNGSATIGWFRYATSAPASCDDNVGTRVPTSGGLPLGAGTASVPFAQALAGLAPGLTYYYCAFVSNAGGSAVGEVQSFTTAVITGPPVVRTEVAMAVTTTTATINGAVDPNFADSLAWFRFSSTSPGTCNDSFGTRVPAAEGTPVSAGSGEVAYAEDVEGLAPGTTYYFCAVASNAAGLRFGSILLFTTSPAAPDVTTLAPTEVGGGSATLNGSALPNGDNTTAWFRYDSTDPGTCSDSFGVSTQGVTNLGAGTTPVAYSQTVSGLTPGTRYYFCAVATSRQGTSFGTVLSFIPGLPAPVVTTGQATSISDLGATLAGTVTPTGSDTLAWFRYGEDEPGSCSDAFGSRAPSTGGITIPAGEAAVPLSQVLAGLHANTTYFYCAAASNMGGASFGEVRSFKTSAVPPTVRTIGAAAGAARAFVLNGGANPRGSDTTAWFRYGSTDPGTCSESFGARTPEANDAKLGAGNVDAPFTQTVTGLFEGKNYFCAVASNESGTVYGEVQSFEVSPEPVRSSGCGCGPNASGAGLVWLAPLLMLAFRRRRRPNFG